MAPTVMVRRIARISESEVPNRTEAHCSPYIRLIVLRYSWRRRRIFYECSSQQGVARCLTNKTYEVFTLLSAVQAGLIFLDDRLIFVRMCTYYACIPVHRKKSTVQFIDY